MDKVSINIAVLLVMFFIFYYVLLEPVAGLMYTPFLLFLAYSAAVFAKRQDALFWSLGLHFFSWLAQILSHFVIEKRAPAFIDNFAQAFLMAPLFVFIEVLFVFGYRPNLKIKIDTKVEVILKKLKNQ